MYNEHLRYPRVFGVRIGRDNIFPAELCTVEEGQLYRKKIPAEVSPEFLRFSIQRPAEKLRTIEAAIAGPVSVYRMLIQAPWITDSLYSANNSVTEPPISCVRPVLPSMHRPFM